MRFAILADIHGNDVALREVLNDVQLEGIKQFIILGDVVMVGPNPQLVMNTIKALNPTCWIKGNTDMWFEEITEDWTPSDERGEELYRYFKFCKDRLTREDKLFLTNLPIKESIKILGKSILCVHGSPRKANEIMDYRVPIEELEQMLDGVTETIVLCGHSHVPYVGTIAGKHIFNVGSVGRPLDGDKSASYGILDLSLLESPQFMVKRVNYSIDETIKISEQLNFPNMKKFKYTLESATIA